MSSLQTIQRALERRRPSGPSRNPYARALGAAAAVVSLAGLGIGLYMYSRWTPDVQPGQGGDEWAAAGGRNGAGAGPAGGEQSSGSAAKGKGPASAPAAKRGPRPTLSLSLPPSFDRSSAQALQHLHTLIATLAEHFVIHLILPDYSTSQAAIASPPPAPSTGTGALAAVFADVLDFDARRLLLYSTAAGRQAISLALACDAHVEVSLHGSPATEGRPETDETKKRLEHLQRASGVVVLLVLPSPDASQVSTSADADLDEVLDHFKKASFSKSVRIVDTRGSPDASATRNTESQWEAGGASIAELRAKMKR